jgi:predicted DNA-binding protein with PD1-like motif
MRLRKLFVPAMIVWFALAIAAVPGFAISKEFNQTYTLQPGGTFELQNVNGTVEVQGWDKDVVEVRAVKTAKLRESDLERVAIDVHADANGVAVLTRYPQNEGVEVAVEYTIHVPRGAKVEHLGTVNGTLRVAGVSDVDELRTVNGNIEVYEAESEIHAHTTNGNVHLELSHVQGMTGTVAETTNGSVVLVLPANAQADLEAQCLNGNFQSELPFAMEGSLKPREIHGKLGQGGSPIKLHTINGGIRVVALRTTV